MSDLSVVVEMRRRDFLVLLSCVPFFSASAHGRAEAGVPKLAILSPESRSYAFASGSGFARFLRALQELGYVEGRNISIEMRFAENQLDRLPALASELVAWGPNVIYTYATPGARAAAHATTSIPIVVGVAGEAALLALAGNLARPKANVTGLSLEGQGPGQNEKLLELLKEVAPHALRIGALLNPANPAWANYPAILNAAAARLGLVLVGIECRGSPDIERTLARLDDAKIDALLTVEDTLFLPDDPVTSVGGRVIEFARERRLPSASTTFNYARYGGLLSLGADRQDLGVRGADYVRKIIEGARPGDLPIERPSKFLLSVNLLTARAIGLAIPPAVLARADEVIE